MKLIELLDYISPAQPIEITFSEALFPSCFCESKYGITESWYEHSVKQIFSTPMVKYKIEDDQTEITLSALTIVLFPKDN